MFIAKFPKGLLHYTWEGAISYRNFKFDPCYGTASYEEILNGKYYCPHGEGGLGENQLFNDGLGSSFIALFCTDILLWQLSWDIFRENMFQNYSIAQDKLWEVGIDKSEMVTSAVRV